MLFVAIFLIKYFRNFVQILKKCGLKKVYLSVDYNVWCPSDVSFTSALKSLWNCGKIDFIFEFYFLFLI